MRAKLFKLINSVLEPTLAKVLSILFFLAILVVVGVALTFGYKLGFKKGYHKANVEATLTDDGEALTAENIKAIRLENDILKNKVTTAQQERDISLTNLSELRQAQQDLKITNLQLEQVNEVLTKTLAEHGGISLQILGAKIEPLPENAFEYRFDIAMLTEDAQAKTLIPKLTLLNDTSLVEVPLEPSRYKIKGIARIRGRFLMPKGFNPSQVKIQLSAGNEKIEQLYNWRAGKRVDNMPLTLTEVPDVDQRPVS